MNSILRKSSKQLRLWLLAAAAVLLITSVLEAGHIHGTIVQVDDHCVLCQHSVALDKTLTSAKDFVVPLLLISLLTSVSSGFIPLATYRSTPIRAPPAFIHTH